MKKPFAYISAAWSGREFEDSDQAAVYCRKVYEAGFTPICPLLYLPHFLNDSVPAEHKDGIDMGRELLRRSHVLIVCGDTVDENVKNDIAVAQRLSITATTLDGNASQKNCITRGENCDSVFCSGERFPVAWGKKAHARR